MGLSWCIGVGRDNDQGAFYFNGTSHGPGATVTDAGCLFGGVFLNEYLLGYELAVESPGEYQLVLLLAVVADGHVGIVSLEWVL